MAGRKSLGEIRPWRGWRHRTSASAPQTSPVVIRTFGWKRASNWPLRSAPRQLVRREWRARHGGIPGPSERGEGVELEDRLQLPRADRLLDRAENGHTVFRGHGFDGTDQAPLEVGGDDQRDRELALGHRADERDAIHVGHGEVAQDHIDGRPADFEDLQRAPRDVRRKDAPRAERLEQLAETAVSQRLVFDDQEREAAEAERFAHRAISDPGRRAR